MNETAVNETVASEMSVIDADGHVEPAAVLDWQRVIGGAEGREVAAAARRWFDLVGHGSSTQRGAWDAVARLRDADIDGIDIAVLFGSSKGPGCVSGGNASLEPAIARAFNDWLAGFCDHDPKRLKATAWVPLHDIDAACAEARRAMTHLCAVGVVINPCVGDYALDDPHFFPLWRELSQLDAPALVHGTGGVGDFLSKRYHTHPQRHAVSFPLSLQMALMDLICGGVLERFPKLRVALFEGGVGWLPWWIDRLDEHFELAPYALPHIRERPSVLLTRYISERRFFITAEPDEAHLAHAIGVLGDHAVMFASDYPHWDCTFPGAVALLNDRTDLSATTRKRLLLQNAADLYGARL